MQKFFEMAQISFYTIPYSNYLEYRDNKQRTICCLVFKSELIGSKN